MKHITFILFFLSSFQAYTQTVPQERCDTIHGVAMVLDTIQVFSFVPGIGKEPGHYEPVDQLSSAIWPSYAITRYILLVDGKGENRPRINSVNYYRFEDCAEIPFNRIFAFKQQ